MNSRVLAESLTLKSFFTDMGHPNINKAVLVVKRTQCLPVSLRTR